MKKLFLINAFILIGSSLIFNTIGISFRVFITNKIGAEATGLFQLIMSIYMMAIIFVVTGINIAVTRLVAEEGGRKSFSVSNRVLRKAFLLSLLYSVPAFLVVFFGAEVIGRVFLNDERTILSLKILALGLPCTGIASCIRGYFYAVAKIIRPTSAQAIDITVQLIVILSILDLFLPKGLDYACAAVVIGATISEFVSCLYVLLLYQIEVNRNSHYSIYIRPKRRIFRRLIYISLPVSTSSLLRSGLKALENIMIPVGFQKYGYSKKLSLEEYGMIQGMVVPIILFPATILASFSALLIPEISEANSLNHKKRIQYSVNRVLQLTSIMAFLVTGIFLIFADEISASIYDKVNIGEMMRILAPLVPLMYLDMVVDAMLKGLDQQVSVLKYNLIDSLFRIILVYSLIPMQGVTGLIIVIYASNFLNTILSIYRLLKVSHIKMKYSDWILKPVLSMTVSGILALLFINQFNFNTLPPGVPVAVGIIFMSVLYILFLIVLNCITKEDLKWFKNVIYT